MALSRSELESIVQIISERLTRFTYEALGERALTSAELSELKRAGLLRRGERHLVADPVILGKIVALLPPSARGLSYSDVLSLAKRMEPMTAVEQQAIDFATEHAGEYIRGIRDVVVRDVRAMAARGRSAALRAVQEGVSQAIADRQTSRELKTTLFDKLDDASRDWQRVAHTEMNTAIQNGIYREIRDKSDDGENQLVFKRPAPDACKHCKKLYLKSDGITPRIFRLKDLEESNVGMKAADWQPTIGSVHPWCACQLHVLPEGYSFVKRRVASEDVGTFKSGTVIEEREFNALSTEDKKKTRVDAVLAFTGETATPEE